MKRRDVHRSSLDLSGGLIRRGSGQWAVGTGHWAQGNHLVASGPDRSIVTAVLTRVYLRYAPDRLDRILDFD